MQQTFIQRKIKTKANTVDNMYEWKVFLICFEYEENNVKL